MENRLHKGIRRIELSEKDVAIMENIRKLRAVTSNEQPSDYKNKVVIKPWGHEFLIFENECVAIWFLYIKKGHSTSMHCHPNKKTSLVVLCGNALCNTFQYRNFLNVGGALMIEPGVFHSTKALSLGGISLIEVETPPKKTDLVRLDDEYGRELCGYEGCQEMKMGDLNEFNYFHFEEPTCRSRVHKVSNTCAISMEKFPNGKEFEKSFEIHEACLYSVCKGSLLSIHGIKVLGVGDIQKGELLGAAERIRIDGETTLMKIELLSITTTQ